MQQTQQTISLSTPFQEFRCCRTKTCTSKIQNNKECSSKQAPLPPSQYLIFCNLPPTRATLQEIYDNIDLVFGICTLTDYTSGLEYLLDGDLALIVTTGFQDRVIEKSEIGINQSRLSIRRPHDWQKFPIVRSCVQR